MDTVTLVENEIDEGQRLLGRVDDEKFMVTAAGWAKPVDEDRWTLYIATSVVDTGGIMVAYRQLTDTIRSLDDFEIDSSYIKLIGENHPIARKFEELNRRLTGKPWIHCGAMVIGNNAFDDAYIYSPRFVKVRIYGMIFDGHQPGPLHLSLEPHNPTSKLIIGEGSNSKEYPAKTGIDWEIAAPEGASLERSEIGLMILAWNFGGHRTRSSANEVWSFAKLEMHGFRFLKMPS
jgi:hypothetical protein